MTAPERPVRAHCPLGGLAPCVDDLCHGVTTTICGLEESHDFCWHGWVPDTCNEGCNGDGEYDDDE